MLQAGKMKPFSNENEFGFEQGAEKRRVHVTNWM